MKLWLPVVGSLVLVLLLGILFCRTIEGLSTDQVVVAVPDGFYVDDQGQQRQVPLGYVAKKDKRGYEAVTETTQQGSLIPVSNRPDQNDLLHHDENNFGLSYHSVDAAQYFNVDAIDEQGNIQFDELHDLFPPVQLHAPPVMPTYADSVLYSAIKNHWNHLYKHPGVSF